VPGALAHDVATIDLVDETFVVATPAQVAARLQDPAEWRRWWPDLTLTVFQDRGERGIRWNVTGALQGSCEVWLEAVRDGTLVHHYLRGARGGGGAGRGVARERARRARAWKQVIFALKDELEGSRGQGPPAARRCEPS
jgi:hypothetical protein